MMNQHNFLSFMFVLQHVPEEISVGTLSKTMQSVSMSGSISPSSKSKMTKESTFTPLASMGWNCDHGKTQLQRLLKMLTVFLPIHMDQNTAMSPQQADTEIFNSPQVLNFETKLYKTLFIYQFI